MKKIKLSLVAALSAVLMLTSCLSEGSNEFSWTGYGVVDYSSISSGYRKVLYWSDSDLPIYYTGLELEDNKYVYVSFSVNTDDEVNADAVSKGYYVGPIQIFDYCTAVSVRNNYSFDPESAVSGDEEVIPSSVDLKQWVKDALFAEVVVPKFPKDSKLKVYVEYNPDQTPSVEDKMNVYDFYLRTEVESSESTTASSYGERCAINMKEPYDRVHGKEAAANNEKFGIRLNWVKSIDEEDDTITWEDSVIIAAYVQKES